MGAKGGRYHQRTKGGGQIAWNRDYRWLLAPGVAALYSVNIGNNNFPSP